MVEQVISFDKTQVATEKTCGEMEEMLRKAGVSQVGKAYSEQRIVALHFQMDTPTGKLPFKMPVNVDAVYNLMWNKRQGNSRTYGYTQADKQRVYDQAERTAWRIIHTWLKGQLALIKTEMVTVTEVFLPYMLVSENETFYQRLQAGDFKALMPGVEVEG